MDITMTTNNSIITTGTTIETPRRIAKIIPFANGGVKRESALISGGVRYTECLKNHAASLGSHALDGCGEFMPAPDAIASDPTSLKCAACGCHRNFHRQEQLQHHQQRVIHEYHPQHRHQPLPPRGLVSPPPRVVAARQVRSPGSDDESPPPISSTYYPVSAPHTLLAMSSGGGGGAGGVGAVVNNNSNNSSLQILNRKRFRTKFSQDQKDKMQEFAEKIEWKMVKSNEGLINEFCNKIGVQRGVFKVWMHNNKSTIGKVPRCESTNYIISANLKIVNNDNNNNNNNKNNNNNNNLMEVDEEHVNGNSNSSINNSHTISLHQHSNASSSSS